MPNKNINKDENTTYKENIVEKNIVYEMENSYLDYAMSVIVMRALPDVRDGLKPVHRRILYSMKTLGLTSGAKFRKSATIVGDVIGKYHPHGDTAVYDSMVRMAQDFSMRYPLIDGQGNFGSIDGDSPAAYRYTEAKMTKIAEELLRDLDKNTVNFRDNFDATRQEPSVLPANLPHLLLNGVNGIAVGMATNIPPHNLGELVDAVIHLIDEPQCSVGDLMKYIKGPDFPTGGIIYNIKALREAYETGRGSIVVRGVAEIIDDKKKQIIITEIPFQVNKAHLIEKIATLVQEKKLIGISDIRDESNREGIRIVIELKKDSFPNKILNQLYQHTQLQTSFGFNMVSLVDGVLPRLLDLKSILHYFVLHRKEVITRRTQFELDEARKRAHILEGLKIALENIDAVIKIIKQSKDKEEARVNLIKKFKLTEIQSDAILDMKLSKLTSLETKQIIDELEQLVKLITKLESILKSEKKIYDVVKTELLEVKEKFNDKRRTQIIKSAVGEFSEEDLVPNEPTIVLFTKENYIKRVDINAFKAQNRGGKGIIGMTTRDEDEVKFLSVSNTHDYMMFFTNTGRVFRIRVFDIPVAQRTTKGISIYNLIDLGKDEKITTMINIPKEIQDDIKYLVMATKNGNIKKTELSEYTNVRKSGLIAIKLIGNDQLIWVKPTSGKDQIMMISNKGMSIRFDEKDARSMGRNSQGTRGIKLKGGEYVVQMDIIPYGCDEKSTQLLTIVENGYGKRTPIEEYRLQKRGGSGVSAHSLNEKTGNIVGAKIIFGTENKDIILISSKGQVIRTSLSSINEIGRVTKGVTVMRMKQADDKVASMTIVDASNETDNNVE